jgi:hypothetical protein
VSIYDTYTDFQMLVAVLCHCNCHVTFPPRKGTVSERPPVLSSSHFRASVWLCISVK